ncbi:hypothetical protein [uncultured Lactobacillus sp.]|uniref:hypothetical protein n=1 Tax=uncultured Lactobacillus sp. TaxID=153152 RepID=UPI0025DDD254|nr:hypothetical protein [uncultured Lactobacillus sp.]
MNNKNYPTVGLKASYYLPFMSLAELASVLLIIAIPYLCRWLKHSFLFRLLSVILKMLKPVLVGLMLFITIGWLVILVMTMIYQHSNSFRNYWTSWFQTFDLRNFAKIPAKYIQVKESDTMKNKKVNDPSDRAFDEAVKGWYVDVCTDALTVWLLMPVSSDSQVIFDQKLPTIENKIRQDNPNFTFSPAERIGNFYRIEATRY